jgi:hypothetical protein
MKPMLHSQSSAKKYGGNPDDYIDIHQWFDDSKAYFPDNRHRALRHHTQGIFEAERVFGKIIVNSEGKQVSVRDIGEQHVLEDLGFIPTLCDYLQFLEYQDWMHGKGEPPSISTKKVSNKINSPNLINPYPQQVIFDGSKIDFSGSRLVD